MADFTFFSLYATSSFFFQTSSEGIVSRRLADVNPKGSKVAREQIGEIREEVELQEVKTQACWDPGLSWKDISPLIDRKDPGFIERCHLSPGWLRYEENILAENIERTNGRLYKTRVHASRSLTESSSSLLEEQLVGER